MKPPVKIEGGAAVSEVELVPLAPEVAETELTVNIVTTAAGTLGPEGIVKIGTEATVLLTAFSSAWMRPKTKADSLKIAARNKENSERKAEKAAASAASAVAALAIIAAAAQG